MVVFLSNIDIKITRARRRVHPRPVAGGVRGQTRTARDRPPPGGRPRAYTPRARGPTVGVARRLGARCPGRRTGNLNKRTGQRAARRADGGMDRHQQGPPTPSRGRPRPPRRGRRVSGVGGRRALPGGVGAARMGCTAAASGGADGTPGATGTQTPVRSRLATPPPVFNRPCIPMRSRARSDSDDAGTSETADGAPTCTRRVPGRPNKDAEGRCRGAGGAVGVPQGRALYRDWRAEFRSSGKSNRAADAHCVHRPTPALYWPTIATAGKASHCSPLLRAARISARA
jgi:hypothetical protein